MKWFILIVSVCILNDLKASTTQAFTIHENGGPINFYLEHNLQKIRIVVYPYIEESNAGLEVNIVSAMNNALKVAISGEYLFCRKGDLAINTRNYNNSSFILYKAPHKYSMPVGKSYKQQTLRIYDIDNGWLFVEGKDDNGKIIRGWLPPEMQCPSVWTTCS